MKRIAVVSSMFFVMINAAFAVTPSEGSLKGVYVFQFFQATENYWQKTVSITCGGLTETFTGSGQTAATEIVHGTMNFTGAGTVSATFTEYGQFNQAASDDTVTIACSGNPRSPFTTNNGHPVFDEAVDGTDTGTYIFGSNGSNHGGTVTFAARTVGLGKLSYDAVGFNSTTNLFSAINLRTDWGTGAGLGTGTHE
ncbi:MAG: hypothetical protein WBE76_17030 [Terracidiphilus sp.]